MRGVRVYCSEEGREGWMCMCMWGKKSVEGREVVCYVEYNMSRCIVSCSGNVQS